jgi:hypothetical protein
MTSPPSTPLVGKWLGLFSSRAVGRWSPVAAMAHRPKLQAKVLSGAPRGKKGKSGALNGSQLLLAAMMMTKRTRQMTPTRNTSLPLSVI